VSYRCDSQKFVDGEEKRESNEDAFTPCHGIKISQGSELMSACSEYQMKN